MIDGPCVTRCRDCGWYGQGIIKSEWPTGGDWIVTSHCPRCDSQNRMDEVESREFSREEFQIAKSIAILRYRLWAEECEYERYKKVQARRVKSETVVV